MMQLSGRTEPPRGRLPITAVVLTRNERRNLPACLASVVDRLAAIVIVDCGSTDETVTIAERHGAKVYRHDWKNYADQFQWALDHVPFETEWVMRLDADERWTEEGFSILEAALLDPTIAGVNVRMRIYFLGRFLRHGGLYPNLFMRVFRRAGARIEQRWMDEHIVVSGPVVSPRIDVIEANYDRQDNIALWTTKHNGYSSREAADVLVQRWRLRAIDTVGSLTGDSTQRRRWLKENVYARTPLFARPFLYFLYRYVFRLGFLDGVPGFVFHVLQAFWYRFLVDVKVYQVEAIARRTGRSIPEVMKECLGIEP